MLNIRVTYLGHRYDAATELPEILNMPPAAKLMDVLAHLRATLEAAGIGGERCVVSLNGERVGSLSDGTKAPLHAGDEIVLRSPLAMG